MNKKLELNISERLAAISILNEFKGNLDTLSVILEDIRKFPVSDEDWTKAERKETKTEDRTTLTWDNDKGGLKKIEIDALTSEYIIKDIEKRDAAGEFGLNDRSYITLKAKLK